MAKVIGYDEKVYKRFTCYECAAIVEYAPNEVQQKIDSSGNPHTDEGRIILGLKCPGCSAFNRTNP